MGLLASGKSSLAKLFFQFERVVCRRDLWSSHQTIAHFTSPGRKVMSIMLWATIALVLISRLISPEMLRKRVKRSMNYYLVLLKHSGPQKTFSLLQPMRIENDRKSGLRNWTHRFI